VLARPGGERDVRSARDRTTAGDTDREVAPLQELGAHVAWYLERRQRRVVESLRLVEVSDADGDVVVHAAAAVGGRRGAYVAKAAVGRA
jgi:hypothetical protein